MKKNFILASTLLNFKVFFMFYGIFQREYPFWGNSSRLIGNYVIGTCADYM